MPPLSSERWTIEALDPLFRPLVLGGITLPNRLTMAPMTRNFSSGGFPGDDVREYYRRRAEGGFGLLLTEGTYVAHPTAGQGTLIPRMDESRVAAWRAVTDAVHAYDTRMFCQLWHAGLMSSGERDPDPSIAVVGPSGLSPEGEAVGEAMSEAQIAEIVEAYARSTVAAVSAGFDGIELHAGHGYLIDQFLWERTNRRKDRYGGGIGERARFAAEIVAACRAAAGPGFPISFRFSQWKIRHYEARLVESPRELERLLGPLAEAGVTVFHCSTRRFREPAFAEYEDTLAQWVGRLTGLPTIAVGELGVDREVDGVAPPGPSSQLREAAEMIERGCFDLIAVGRAAIANPHWPRMIRQGDFDALRSFDRLVARRVLEPGEN